MTDSKEVAPEKEPPGPGVHESIPATEYHSWPYFSNSGAKEVLRSGAHYQAYLKKDWNDDTPAQIIGRAIHMAILEPDDFWKVFTEEPKLDYEKYANPRGTKAYKEEVGFIREKGLRVLTSDDLEHVNEMKVAVLAHPKLNKVITATGRAELSVVWDDPETGVRCKSRIDWHTPTYAGGAVLDLKSTDDASPGAFERAIFRWGYHRQGAFYLRGAREVGLLTARFAIAAVEKPKPHGVILYRLRDEAIRLGEVQLDFALARYKQCHDSGVWPCYTEDVVEIGVPKWADNQVERDLEEQTV
ncbi:MAG: PD-(D/E)XK nuclease-like domain-containing protein [Anaerolineales bacterium]|nr:PD-(D/E)XK nuclease-like domain-containing protein [Anaerolineales bacterium]